MAKLWPSLSILLILAMMLFLVPAVIFAPQNVAVADEEVVQEVEATFTFSETELGDWHTFTAGSGGVQDPGLCLEQFTREYVLVPNTDPDTTVPGCGYRNYTTSSGGTISGDLSGTLSLAWETFTFNQQYPGALYLPGATNFGWLAGRGHIGSDLTFVFVADFDCDDDIMTNAEGKGFMVSTEESGDFASHKVIGGFEVVKTGSAYTWNLHLRNYAPNEVQYKGVVTVDGGVLQEFKDDIYAPLAIVNFTQDGPDITPSGAQATQFEEIAWGKDPFKNVTGGPLGAGGNMDITRNGVQYLLTPGGVVNIQASEACILHIDDTIAQTEDYNSTYGHAYYYLLLALPYQEELIGDYFNQTGYTFYPFGMYLKSTDWYAGAETFALAQIRIESKIGTAHQTSIDWSYGLYPHPNVTSVVPSSGSPGQTIDVTISGKYFLGAKDVVANSGSVDFGDGITVNSYTINDATNPIDNSITASITIDGGASAGVRDVNVTSCFGYENATGTPTGKAPYKSGHGVFNVVAAGASLDGHVGLQGLPATNVTVRFFPGGSHTEAMKAYGTTDASGNFTISGLTPGTYDIAVKGQTSLSNMVTGVDLSVSGRTDFGVLSEGDASNDDYIDASDFGALSFAWLSHPADPNWYTVADFTRDNYIDASDFGALSYYWLGSGACFGWPGDWS